MFPIFVMVATMSPSCSYHKLRATPSATCGSGEDSQRACCSTGEIGDGGWFGGDDVSILPSFLPTMELSDL